MRITRRIAVATFALLATLAATAPARADVLDNSPGTPTWVKTYGNLRVERYGTGSRALVLVPGLSAGSWSWHDLIAREQKTHAIYAVTLAGMAGVPPDASPSLDNVDAGLLTLIESENIDHPVLVGHSLGGSVVLRFGAEHPNLVRAVVDVDGFPVFPSLAQATPAQRSAAAADASAKMLAATPAQFEQTEAATVADFVTDPALAKRVIALCAQSDQKTLSIYFKDLLAADLRPLLPKITVPVLVIATNPGLPLPAYLPPVISSMTLDQRRNGVIQIYTGLMAGTPNVKVVAIDNARHFVMLDQPVAFAQALDAFLATTT